MEENAGGEGEGGVVGRYDDGDESGEGSGGGDVDEGEKEGDEGGEANAPQGEEGARLNLCWAQGGVSVVEGEGDAARKRTNPREESRPRETSLSCKGPGHS